MKRNWLAAFVGTMLWGAGGILSACGAAPALASDPAYYVCPYLAEDFHGSYAYGSDWYLLGPDAEEADAFLAALEAGESEPVDASVTQAKEVPGEATCTIDKSTGESYARYLVEQVYKLYFADRSPSVAPASEEVAELCPAEQDYLRWKQDQLAWSDEEIRDALAAESSYVPETLALEPAQPRQYDWDQYDYSWDGADDPAFADSEGAFLIDETKTVEKASASEAAADYADAERLSAFEEYALWEATYGDCAEAADAWAAVQDEEESFERFWDDVVVSGEMYVPPASIVTVVMNGTPATKAAVVPVTVVRNEDFAAPGQFVAMEREEDTYPREILALWDNGLDLPADQVAKVAAARAEIAPRSSLLETATNHLLSLGESARQLAAKAAAARADIAPRSSLFDTATDRLLGLGESARRIVRNFVLNADERAVLRQVAEQGRRATVLQ